MMARADAAKSAVSRADSIHPAFISRSATLDHVRPIARGGDPTALDNLVTACWTYPRLLIMLGRSRPSSLVDYRAGGGSRS